MSEQIVIENVVGNGKYKATFEPSEAAKAALIRQGLTRVLQGAPSGQAEKELAYPGKGVKRPEGFNRKSIDYSPAFVAAFTKAYEGAQVEVGRNEKDEAIVESLGLVDIEFSEYEGPEKAEPKYKAEKDLLNTYLFEADGKTGRKLASGEPRSAASFATSRGIALPTEPWDEDTEFLMAVKKWAKEQAVSQD